MFYQGYSKIIMVAMLWLVWFTQPVYAQQFRSPVDIPIQLSGTFGELRAGHFHAGIDIRTNARTGYPVFAVADGYVSRIKVSSVGYGYAVYINHAGGYTSVYGHLERYNDVINSFIKPRQYKQENFDVDEFPKATDLPVKKGDLIGYSGNSGSSGGPHLHFEIRDTKTEFPLNPLTYMPAMEDNIPPDIKALYAYALDEKLMEEPVKVAISGKDGAYAAKDTLRVNSNTISFGLMAADKMNGNNFSNDIYKLEMKVDGALVFGFSLDKFGFDDTRYVQAHQDYALDIAEEKKVHRCWKLPGNMLNIYSATNGVITLAEGKTVKVEISAADIAGNTSRVNVIVMRDSKTPIFKLRPITFDPLFHFNKQNTFRASGIELTIPENGIYRDIYFTYSSTFSSSTKLFSPVHHVHKDIEAVHKYYSLSLKPVNMPENLKSKAYISLRYRDGKTRSYNAVWEDGMLTCKTRDFGDFYVVADTTAPTVKLEGAPAEKNYNKSNSIKVFIRDGGVGIDSYRGMIDGKWALFAYDAKNDLLTHEFENTLAPGEHVLKVVVTDKVNNSTTLEIPFKR